MRIKLFEAFVESEFNEMMDTFMKMKPAQFWNLIDFLNGDIEFYLDSDVNNFVELTGLSKHELVHLYGYCGFKTQNDHNKYSKAKTEDLKNKYLKTNNITWKEVVKSAEENPVMSESTIEITNLHWNSETKTFSGEVSDIKGIQGGEKELTVKNSGTGNSVVFKFTKADMDGSEEDTYGWNYENKEKGLKLLIIND